MVNNSLKAFSKAVTRFSPSHAAVILLALGFFLVGVNRLPVPTVDGVVRAQMAKNVLDSGSLWPIMYEGRAFNDHPPLYIWLTTLSYKIFGVSDFAANVMPRFFAFLLVILTAAITSELGFGLGTALLAALILCLTRDFVLSSVRGYIEPLLEFFSYLSVYFALVQRHTKKIWPAAAAGVAVWFAAYSKGPVALWPFLFTLVLLLWFAPRTLKGAARIGVYFTSFAVLTLLWALWVSSRGDWPHWKHYLLKQVVGSAIQGRGGAQTFEPFFFFKILAKFYWPWFPFFIAAIVQLARELKAKRMQWRPAASNPLPRTFALLLIFGFGLGFFAGFSLMKWKFWYYIAPAYPAFAIFIAATFTDKRSYPLIHSAIVNNPKFPIGVLGVASLWIIIGSIFPIKLHHERVPEVMAFKETITGSDIKGSVWFVANPMDHNMVGTSGQWYFQRLVEKVEDNKRTEWSNSKLKAPAWIIAGKDFVESPACKKESWCSQSITIQKAEKSALLLYR